MSLDSAPLPPPLSSSPSQVSGPTPKRRGCLIAFICLGFAAVLLFGGLCFLYYAVLNTYTAPGPVSVSAFVPTPQDLQSAKRAFEELRNATVQNEAREIILTERDFNTIIATEPALRGMRDRLFVQINSATMTVETSLPLRGAKLPGLRDRWLNLTVSFLFGYADGKFSFDLQTATANHEDVPASFLRGANRNFSKRFNDGFRDSLSGNPTSSGFWMQI